MKRRDFLSTNLAIAGTTAIAAKSGFGQDDPPDKPRIRQSVMGWCFKPMDAVTLAGHCKRIGIEAIEGIPAEQYDAVKKIGLQISLTGSHGFASGPVDPDNHAMVEQKLRDGIDLAVKYGAPNVITFTGMTKSGISDDAAERNCLNCWNRVLPYAEHHNVGIVLEHLNSRDDSHPMKGHPGYWGDDIHRCADLVKAVDSPHFRLLFDIYHVQVMNGDLIRNIRRYHPIIGHYHTAGNPGRGELDDSQEISYPAVIRAILDTGYKGYIAQEFLPTGNDPIKSLQHAFGVCNVS